MGTNASSVKSRAVPEGVSVQDYVDSVINDHTITVFSKTWCPYCKTLKGLLSREYADVDIEYVEIDILEDGSAIHDVLVQKTGQSSVPNVFVKKQHIGGNDDTQAAHRSGKLKELIAA
ncbi:thioredoxin-like protein [Schizophyllum fasciatum]